MAAPATPAALARGAHECAPPAREVPARCGSRRARGRLLATRRVTGQGVASGRERHDAGLIGLVIADDADIDGATAGGIARIGLLIEADALPFPELVEGGVR